MIDWFLVPLADMTIFGFAVRFFITGLVLSGCLFLIVWLYGWAASRIEWLVLWFKRRR